MQIQLADDQNGDRIRLMKQRRNDPLREIDLTMYPVHKHLGAAGWQGAHEAVAHVEEGRT